MRPIPIPDATVEAGVPLFRRIVIAGPDGDLIGFIRSVEAMAAMVPHEDGNIIPELNVLIQIEPGDLPILEKHGHRFWLTFTGHIVPFALSVFNPDDPAAGDIDSENTDAK